MKKMLLALAVIMISAALSGCVSRSNEVQETQYQPGLPETLSDEVEFCASCW